MKVTRRFASDEDIQLLFEINRAAIKDHVRANFGSWNDDSQRRMFWHASSLLWVLATVLLLALMLPLALLSAD